MTAAARRRATLPPLAVALAIACLALLAWTASARADESTGGMGVVIGDQTGGGGTDTGGGGVPSQSVDSSDTGGSPSGDAGGGSSTGGTPSQDSTPADTPPGDPTAQQPSDSQHVDNGDSGPPAGSGVDRTEDRTPGVTGDTPESHDSGSRSGSSAGSTTNVVPLGTAEQAPSGLMPEGDLSQLPVTQFTVVPESATTGGSSAGAGLRIGGGRVGCLAWCPGGAMLAAAIRLPLSREARTAVREARDRANGMAAKATAPSLFGLAGGGTVGLFNLLLGGGGGGAAVVFIGFLAVLMGRLALPRDVSSRFRMPSVALRPTAYVAPLELPG
jgi:hypothetical protein